MKKLILLILSVFLMIGISLAQKTNDGSGSGSGGSKKDGGGGEGDNSCNSSILDLATSFLGSYQTNLLGKSTKNPSITSFELFAHGGLSKELNDSVNYYIAIPRVRINYGALSGDIRFDYLKATNEIETETKNIDALAALNIIPSLSSKITIGMGIRYNLDLDTANIFQESLLGFEIGINNKQIKILSEIRYVYDWANKKEMMIEGSVNGAFRLLVVGNFLVYANAGIAYKKLNADIDYGLIYAGLNFIIQ